MYLIILRSVLSLSSFFRRQFKLYCIFCARRREFSCIFLKVEKSIKMAFEYYQYAHFSGRKYIMIKNVSQDTLSENNYGKLNIPEHERYSHFLRYFFRRERKWERRTGRGDHGDIISPIMCQFLVSRAIQPPFRVLYVIISEVGWRGYTP